MPVPLYISLLFIALVVILFAAVISGLNYALKKSVMPLQKRRSKVMLTACILLIWLVIQAILSIKGFFMNFTVMPPRIALVVLPSFIAVLILAFSKRFQPVFLQTPLKWMIGLQSFRIAIEIILWLLFIHAVIPVQMTFEGRNFDILIGLSAPFAAQLLTGKNSKTGLIVWNIAGLILLLNIVIIANLSTPSPTRVFTDGPANSVIGCFPFIWLPGFVVPLALALHVFSLKALMHKNEGPQDKIV